MEAGHPVALIASCRCGEVAFELQGDPILSVVCHCTSCQEAGSRFVLRADAPPVLDKDGGTPFVLYRKDRVGWICGEAHLEAHRLKPDASTRRVVAACCHAPMFLEFSGGHWLSVYRDRLPEGAPPLQMRVMTADRRAGVDLPADIPNYGKHSVAFMWKLLVAWAAMGFRAPKMFDTVRAA